jgi:hypothetical protein
MGALAVGGGKFAGGDEATAEEGLFVFAVEEDDLHGQILILTKQHADLGMADALLGREALPVDAMTAEGVQGLGQARKKGFFKLIKLELGMLVSAAEGLAFAFDEREDFLAESEMFAEVRSNLRRRNQCVSGAPGLLVAGRSQVRFAILAFSNQAR